MVMGWLFLVWLQGHFKNAQPLVFEDDLVVGRSRDYGVSGR